MPPWGMIPCRPRKPTIDRASSIGSFHTVLAAMARGRLAFCLLAALCSTATAVRIVAGPDQTSIPRDPLTVSPDPAGELDLADPRLVRKVTDFQPEGIHLTQWTPSSMLVSWQTGAELVFQTGTTPSRPEYTPTSVAAFVKWGTRSGRYSWVAQSSDSAVYKQVYDARGGNTTYFSPIMHHVIIDSLRPGTTYFYVVGNDRDGWSQEKSFTTVRRNFPVRFGFIGDLGETANSSDTLTHLRYNNPDAVILLGDFTYADNHASNNSGNPSSTSQCTVACTYQPRWDAWMRFVEPVFSTTPFISCKGNHEIEPQLATPGRVSFASANARFPYPQDADLKVRTDPMNGEDYLDAASGYRAFKNEAGFLPTSSYYSIDYPGIAHFISLNNYIPYGPDSKQYKWLLQDLEAVDRKRTPWLIVTFHVPPYHTYNTHFKESDTFMSIYESLFIEHGVDVVLSGHVHAYERTYPLEFYQKVEDGPMYITVGDAGNIEGLYRAFMDDKALRTAGTQAFCDQPINIANPSQSFRPPSYQPTPSGRWEVSLQDGKFCPDSQPEWSAFRQPSFGHGILDVFSPTLARWRWHRNSQGLAVVADEVVISRAPAQGQGQWWKRWGERRGLRAEEEHEE